MSFLLTLIQAAGLGCASAAAGRRVMHYLQLESYQLPGYIKSVKRNAMRALIPPIAMAAVGVAALKVSGLFGLALLLEALTAALLAWQAAKEKAKKPFVATERVKRLTAVHGRGQYGAGVDSAADFSDAGLSDARVRACAADAGGGRRRADGKAHCGPVCQGRAGEAGRSAGSD